MLSFLAVCLSLAFASFTNMLRNPFIQSSVLAPVPVDGSVAYPTVVVCPVQFPDRWNLQRAVLNQVRMYDEHGEPEKEPFGKFKVTAIIIH